LALMPFFALANTDMLHGWSEAETAHARDRERKREGEKQEGERERGKRSGRETGKGGCHVERAIGQRTAPR
jgi:hypothetical protein